MKRIFSILLSLLAISTICAKDYEVKVGDFTKLKVPNNLTVVYHCSSDSAGIAILRNCPNGMASSVLFSNNGTLKVEVATDYKDNPELPTVHVYSAYLQEVSSSSERTVTVISPNSGPEFKARLYGNGSLVIENVNTTQVKAELMTGRGVITISGRCDKAKLGLTGTGEVRADELMANFVKCSIWGTGAIYCHPLKELRSDGIGSTSIYYVGKPEKIKKTGGGKFIPIE